MSRRPVVTLLTDYGPGSEHVGALHAVLAAGCPTADRLDLVHDIPLGAIAWGALLLDRLAPLAPPGVHLAVVDPGVGTERRALAVACRAGRVLVGPDNGLLGIAARHLRATAAVALPAPTGASATFHGRDVMAPAAARLAAGEPLVRLGEPVDPATIVMPALPGPRVTPGRVRATVIGRDRFGNLTLWAGPRALDRAGLDGRLRLGDGAPAGTTARRAQTFADVPPGTLLVYVDAHRLLAVAVRDGDAAARLGLGPGDRLSIEAAPG